ncbi:hypothetical protein MPSEU_000255300 [Mayamaea pseudoterrestris]|nr:hypothetical protein MPSEU_000255300 [Mayamaea pseudoterrestris]
MWGISFDDMARKAAELQEQATQAAGSLAQSATPVSVNFSSPKAFFNLDGIQEQEESAHAAAAAAAAATQTAPPVLSDPPIKNTLEAPEPLSTDSTPVENTEAVSKTESGPGRDHTETTPPVRNMDRDASDENKGVISAAPSADGWGEDDLKVEDMSDDDNIDQNVQDVEIESVGAIATNVDVPVNESKAVREPPTAPENEEPTIYVESTDFEAAVDEAAPQPVEPNEEVGSASEASTHDDLAQKLDVAVQDQAATDDSAIDDSVQSLNKSQNAVPDAILENFSQQLQRLEENFAAERKELMQQHAIQVEQLKASFTHDECQAHRASMEEEYKQQMQTLDERLHNIARKNEGYRLKIDMLQREVDGTKKLLEERDGDMGKTQNEHGSVVKGLQEQLLAEQRKSTQLDLDVKRLNEKLDTAANESKSQQLQHVDLKERMKALAVELKERRQECRQLKMQVENQNETNERLQREVDGLRLQISNQGLNSTEKDEELNQVRASLVDAKAEITKAHQALLEQESRFEKMLADYKKKAQNSLALTNSRAAAAVQAKEEAELEARSARSTADMAMDKAVQAELTAKRQVAEARHQVQELELEKSSALKENAIVIGQLKDLETEIEKTKRTLKESEGFRERIADEHQKTTTELRQYKALLANLQLELSETKQKETDLRQGLSTAREELQQLRKALGAAQAAGMQPSDDEQQSMQTKTKASATKNNELEASMDEETMASFQRELFEARETNEELKQALAIVIAENDNLKQRRNGMNCAEDKTNNSMTPQHSMSNDAEWTPLFYAIEKQAELKTARDEIARLANFLSKVQSEKSEAEESVAAIRQRMEEAETRLKLFNKFGRHLNDEGATTTNGNGGVAPTNSSIVSIEYLKNIMLRYLNAKSVKEKKALVPAIGAVLEFTSDEQRAAIQNVEEGASLGGVGSSLFETISFKLSS